MGGVVRRAPNKIPYYIPNPVYLGKRFYRWTILEFVGRDKDGTSDSNRGLVAKCRCTCGTEREVPLSRVVQGNSQSCGCYKWEVLTRHGHAGNNLNGPRKRKRAVEYSVWAQMIARCENPNNAGYHLYGGRGITVCFRWRESFSDFLSDMGHRPNNKYSIERINNNGPYSPENCKWALVREQNSNTRRNKFLILDGKRFHLAEWGRRTGFSTHAIQNRLRLGWSVRDTLTIKPNSAKNR